MRLRPTLASTDYGSVLAAEGQTVVVLEGDRIARIRPDGVRVDLGIDRAVRAAMQRTQPDVNGSARQ